MSETKFTPGPWKLVKEDQDWGVDLIIRMGDAIRSPCAHDAAHAFTYYEGLEPESQNKEWIGKVLANAHLIAAAPDLYAALEEVTKWLVDQRDFALGNGYPEEYAAVDAANAALAKARGTR